MREKWAGRAMYDVADSAALPEFLRDDSTLRAEYASTVMQAATTAEEFFESVTISSRRITSGADVVSGLFRLLEAHKHARR
mgnify:FL=1